MYLFLYILVTILLSAQSAWAECGPTHCAGPDCVESDGIYDGGGCRGCREPRLGPPSWEDGGPEHDYVPEHDYAYGAARRLPRRKTWGSSESKVAEGVTSVTRSAQSLWAQLREGVIYLSPWSRGSAEVATTSRSPPEPKQPQTREGRAVGRQTREARAVGRTVIRRHLNEDE